MQQEAVEREFEAEGLHLNFMWRSWYLGAYMGPSEELEAWVRSQVEAWAHRVQIIGKYPSGNPKLAHAILGVLL